MKAITIYTILIFLISSPVKSQNSIDAVMTSIEKNNTTIAALRDRADADIIRSHTGIQLQNPEFGINYLRGNPTLIGNRTDFSLLQTFDFPTSYGYKSKIADIQKNQAELKFQTEKREILLKANLLCIDIVYRNKLMVEYKKWLINAQELAQSYKAKFDAGDISILEYNKSKLNLLTAQKEYQMLELEMQSCLAELTAMNGGAPVLLNDTVYSSKTLPADFEIWYSTKEESLPAIQWFKQENEICRMNEKLNASMSLPKFTTGYMSENNPGQKFQGVSLGLSIPLWENKNQVKYARANSASLVSLESDYKMILRNKLKTLFDQSVVIQKTLNEYGQILASLNSTSLLAKALNQGEISLIEYLMELNIYFTSIREYLDTEKEYQQKLTELMSYN
ncbi:MAG: transporter [Bacteroidetes bacterium HGW-Bacteroidetes-21]|jgi:outer membrane protein TolC|nr:MAG: transporter [Bacteroidetes bacterium HGW-Bacteroidetes-21]